MWMQEKLSLNFELLRAARPALPAAAPQSNFMDLLASGSFVTLADKAILNKLDALRTLGDENKTAVTSTAVSQ